MGLDELPGKSNYFLGNDPKKWRTNVPNYAGVQYKDVYPGIDLVFHGKESGVRLGPGRPRPVGSQESEGRGPKGLAEDRQLEYDWVVAPGADLAAIRLAVETADRRLETGKSKLETGKSKIENGNPKFEAGKWKVETGNSKLANPESRTANPGDLRIDPNGDLVIATEAGEVRFRKPVVYQEQSPVNSRQLTVTKGEPQRTTDNGLRTTSNSFNRQSSVGNRQFLAGRYVLLADNCIGFEIPAYDSSKPLVIDPVLSYSTYLGGRGNDEAFGIAVDVNGNAYVTGMTTLADFPTSSGAFDKSCGSDDACNVDSIGNVFPDAFVTKLDRSGSAVIYSTYLGGTGDDRGYAIALDSSGNAYVAGLTSSNDFPTTLGALDAICGNAGNCGSQPQNYNDAFVTKLNRSGSTLVYSTYLGGSSYDFAYGIAVDASGNAYVTGATYSTDFPTANPFQATPGGGSYDAFVSKLNAAGTALVYSTYFGGSAGESGSAISVDRSGRAYVTGTTYSTDFPTKNAFQATRSGSGYSADAFVAKFQASGSALVYSTYLGGSENEFGLGVASDTSGDAYVTGWTWSTDFPTANAFQAAISGTTCSQFGNSAPCPDAFVAKLNAAGSALVYSTYLGGSNYEYARAIAVDSAGNAYVAGMTWSTDFPTMSPFQAVKGGPACASSPDLSCRDAFVAKLNPAGDDLVYSTFFGGAGGEEADGIAVDASGNAYVTGLTTSSDFPKTIGAYDTTCGTADGCLSDQYGYPTSSAFVAKISPSDAPGVSVSSTALGFAPQIVGTRSAPRTFRLNNTGSAPLAVTAIAASGDFEVVTHTCGTSVEAGTNCSIQVTFRPTAEGVGFGNVTVTDNARGGQHRISLRGVGIGQGSKRGSSNSPPHR